MPHPLDGFQGQDQDCRATHSLRVSFGVGLDADTVMV